MIIYILFFLFLIFAIFDVKKNCRSYKYKYIFGVSVVIIILMSGLRWETGSDWDEYIRYFFSLRGASFGAVMRSYSSGFEVGYLLYTYVLANLFGNYTIYLCVTAMLICLLTYCTIYKHVDYPLVILFYVYCASTGFAYAVPRQGVAIALLIYSYNFVYEKKLKKYLLVCLVAILFHNTAIFAVPLYWISNIQFTKSKSLCLLGISYIAGYGATNILERISYLTFLPPAITVRLRLYLSMIGGDATTLTGAGGRILTRGFVLGLIFLGVWKSKYFNQKVNWAINSYIIAICIYSFCSHLGGGLSDVFVRIAYYYEYLPQYIIFSESVRLSKNKRDMKIILILFCVLKFVVGKMFGYGNGYMSIFSV